jgi:predicted O-methyltransferase YrrM
MTIKGNKEMTDPWNVGELLHVSSAYWKGCTLQAAVRLEIFTHIDDTSITSEKISELAGTNDRATGLLANALTAIGLLTKSDQCYSNTPFSRKFLSKNSPHYMGHIVLHHHQILDGWAQLDVAVRTGQSVERRSYGADIERESFIMGMFNLASGTAPVIAEKISLQGRKHLLDLGGGPGTHAIHFCLKNPGLHATIFDRPTTEPFAQKIVASFGLSPRFSFVGGDFNRDPISGGPFDVAWLSHILHSNSKQQCQEIIDKTVAEMSPGGLLLIHDFILDNSKTQPEFAALFSLNMVINSSLGRSYSREEISTMLNNAGVSAIEYHELGGPSQSSIILGVV